MLNFVVMLVRKPGMSVEGFRRYLRDTVVELFWPDPGRMEGAWASAEGGNPRPLRLRRSRS